MMEEFQNLKNEFEALRNSLMDRNIEEIGLIELRRIKGDLERLHSRNIELQENLRFDRTIDTYDLMRVLNEGNTLYDEMANLLRPVSETVSVKAALGMSKVRTRRDLVNARSRNQELINMFTSNIETANETLRTVTDENVKNLYNQNISNLQENINRLNEVDAYYAGLISNLDKDIETIRFGGKVVEIEESKDETRGITKEEEEELKRKEATESKVEEPTHENPLPSLEVPKGENSGIPELKPADSIEKTEEMPPREAFGLVNPGTHEEPTAKTEVEEEMPSRGSFGLSEPESKTEEEKTSTETTPETEKEEEMPSRESFGLGEPTSTEESASDETKEDEETPVDATVKQPKSTLWQKLQPIIEGVKVFLLTAIAVHTGLGAHAIINNANNTETSTDTENDKSEEEQKESPAITPEEEAKEEVPVTPAPAPADTTPGSGDKKEEEKKDEDKRDEEKISIELAPGEFAYNTETGVEINSSGNAVVHKEDGTIGRLTDRELEHTDHGTTIVTNSDLENTGEIVMETLPRTGQEISEEQARANMTEQEEANYNEAISQAFSDFINNGPTL